jgi:hypothetical protein
VTPDADVPASAVRHRGRTLALLAVLLLVGGVAAVRSARTDGPSADAQGLFPATLPAEPGLRDGPARLVAAWADTSTSFRAEMPEHEGDEEFYVVCSSGTVTVGSTSRPCSGRVEGLFASPVGHPGTGVDASVDVPQTGRWGVAVYTSAAP